MKPTGSTTRPESEYPPLPECPACGGAGFFRADVEPGHSQFGKLIQCNHPSHSQERIKRLAHISGLHQQDTRRRLDDIKPNGENKEMLAVARQMIDNPLGWLYLHGGPGNAKSEVLIAIVNEINASDRGPAIYVKFSQLVNWMRDAFGERNYRQKQMSQGVGPDTWQQLGYIDRFERIKKIKVLAIDELDKARLTEFAQEFQFDFLDERYRQAIHGETATIFAGQTPPDELPDPLSSRVMDGRFLVIYNAAGDARPAMGWSPYKDD